MNEVDDFLQRHADAIHDAIVKQEFDEIFSKIDLKVLLERPDSPFFFPIIDSIHMIDYVHVLDRPKMDNPGLSAAFKTLQGLVLKSSIKISTIKPA